MRTVNDQSKVILALPEVDVVDALAEDEVIEPLSGLVDVPVAALSLVTR